MTDRNHILVIVEYADGAVKPVSHEVIAYASSVAAITGGDVLAMVIGHNIKSAAEEIASFGGCDVIAVECDAAAVYNAEIWRYLIKKVSSEFNSQLILIPHTSTGWDFAPALAVDLKASCITAISGLKNENGPVFSRDICNGKMTEDVRPLLDRPAVITITPGAMRPESASAKGAVRLRKMEAPPPRAKTLRYVEAPARSMNLGEAEAIVAVGRGLNKPEELSIIRELASLFDKGAIAGSRPIIDAGWLPLEAQVGMTGQTVSSKLYIACGISGAIQHTMAMKNSNLIVAINTDKNALFCKVAHYCVIADLHEFVPVLIRKIQAHKDVK